MMKTPPIPDSEALTQILEGDLVGADAFTLLELLTVIAIISVLLGLLFPAIRAAKEASKKSLASTEVRRIVTAVEAFHMEYGRYPLLPPAGKPRNDVCVGDRRIGMKIRNRELFYTLCSVDAGINSDFAVNPRKVVYFEGPNVSDPAHPQNGFLRSSNGDERDCYFDPWGNEYCVAIDYSYDGTLKLAYMDYSGDHAPRVGVGAFSLGADQSLGASGNMAVVDGTKVSDDVISWK